MSKQTKMRVVLNNGTHRDFETGRVFTESDIKSLLTDVLIFVKNGQRSYSEIHSWYPVEPNEIGDSRPA